MGITAPATAPSISISQERLRFSMEGVRALLCVEVIR